MMELNLSNKLEQKLSQSIENQNTERTLVPQSLKPKTSPRNINGFSEKLPHCHAHQSPDQNTNQCFHLSIMSHRDQHLTGAYKSVFKPIAKIVHLAHLLGTLTSLPDFRHKIAKEMYPAFLLPALQSS